MQALIMEGIGHSDPVWEASHLPLGFFMCQAIRLEGTYPTEFTLAAVWNDG
jgi:hypothetical protein